MKKILLFLWVIAPFCFAMAQGGTFLTENFDGAGIPSGWTVLNQNSNWSVVTTNNAGGEPNELRLYYNPSFNAKTRVKSPVIDLTGETDVVVEFLHYLDNYTGSHKIGIETTSDGGTTWNLAFEKSYSSSGSFSITEVINTSDVGSSNFQFCLFYEGYSYNINYWYFDNIKLFGRKNLDGAVKSINATTYDVAGDYAPTFSVINNGMTEITSLKVQYQYNNLTPVVETFSSLDIASLATKTLTFSNSTLLIPNSYELKVEILEVNGVPDDLAENNILTKNVHIATCEAERLVTIEHFTSSTCGPCVSPNAQMLTLLNNNPGKYSISKYQMSWPGTGDPYYTAEGGVRRTYYNVNAVPEIYFNAKKISGVNQTSFDNALNEKAFLDIIGVFEVENETITVHFDVVSHVNIPEARVFVVVNEKMTTGNVGSNGETQFRHVMMKFLPDAEGTTSSFVAGDPKAFDFTQNLSSTNVEEFDDLEVNVFVQDYGSGYMFNSKFLMEDATHPAAPKSLVLTDNGDGTTFTANWVIPEIRSLVGYNIYLNGELKESAFGETTYILDYDQTNSVNTVEVEAVYDDELKSVRISNFIVYGGSATHTITASVEGEGGTIAPNGNVTVEEGASQTFTITPAANYIISQVLIDGENNEEAVETGIYTFENVTQNHTIAVSFEKLQTTHIITATVEKYDCSSCSLDPVGEIEVIEGENQTFTITGLNGVFNVFRLFIDDEMLEMFFEDTEYTFENVTSNHAIHVIFSTWGNIDETESNNISIFPNPTSNKIYIEGFDGNTKTTLYLYDFQGRLLSEYPVRGEAMEIDISEYAAGVYFLQYGGKVTKVIKN